MLFQIAQHAIACLGVACFCWLLYLFFKTRKERWEVTDVMSGMIVGELICVAATTVFSMSSLLKMSNEIGPWIAIFLRAAIYLSLSHFTGRLVARHSMIHKHRLAAQVGWNHLVCDSGRTVEEVLNEINALVQSDAGGVNESAND